MQKPKRGESLWAGHVDQVLIHFLQFAKIGAEMVMGYFKMSLGI